MHCCVTKAVYTCVIDFNSQDSCCATALLSSLIITYVFVTHIIIIHHDVVCHCLATKVFIGKLPAMRWVEVTIKVYTHGVKGDHGQTN